MLCRGSALERATLPGRSRASGGTRTHNLLITNQLLYQLSYASDEFEYHENKSLYRPWRRVQYGIVQKLPTASLAQLSVRRSHRAAAEANANRRPLDGIAYACVLCRACRSCVRGRLAAEGSWRITPATQSFLLRQPSAVCSRRGLQSAESAPSSHPSRRRLPSAS